MSDITIYCNPCCVVSRNALTLIRHAGIEPTIIDHLRNRPSREKLLELLEAMQAPVRALVRVHSPDGADPGLYGRPRRRTRCSTSCSSARRC